MYPCVLQGRIGISWLSNKFDVSNYAGTVQENDQVPIKSSKSVSCSTPLNPDIVSAIRRGNH